MIINVTGKKGSGKTTLLGYFQDLGFPVFELYNSYHDLLKKNALADEDIVPNGVWDDSFAKTVYKYAIGSSQDDIVFIGGLLRLSELDFLKSQDTVLSICVTVSSDEDRFERLRERGRGKEASYSNEDFYLRDLNRSGKSSPKYGGNNLDKLINCAEFDINNNSTVEAFQNLVFQTGCKIVSTLMGDKHWRDDENPYSKPHYSAFLHYEALLGGRKKILSDLGHFDTAVALGCNGGRELNLIPANRVTGVDLNSGAINLARSSGNHNLVTCDLFEIQGRYDLSTMLRVVGGSRVETRSALSKVLELADRVATVSVAVAGIQMDGSVKQYGHALNGNMLMTDYLNFCRSELQKNCSVVNDIRTPFEHYFVCHK